MTAHAPRPDPRDDPHDAAEPSPRAVIGAWALAAACAFVIWSLGRDAFAADETSRFFGPFLRWAFPHLSDAQHLFWLGALRKSAHVVEYGTFALLSARALFLSVGWRPIPVALAALLLVGALSGADELRQSFSAVRTGTIRDVGIDLCGAVASLGLFFALQRATGRSWVVRRGGRPSYWPERKGPQRKGPERKGPERKGPVPRGPAPPGATGSDTV